MGSYLSFDFYQRTATRLVVLKILLAGLTGMLVTPALFCGVHPKTTGEKHAGTIAQSNVIPGVVVVKRKSTDSMGSTLTPQATVPLSNAFIQAGVTALVRAFPEVEPLSKAEKDAGKVDISLIHYAAISTSLDPIAVAAQLATLPEVEYAEPKYHYHLADVPDDSDYATLQKTYFDRMHVAEGWAVQKGKAEVIIATVDGGTNWHHPDLAANLWENIGWNFRTNSNDPRGDSTQIVNKNHGTETASAFGAVTNNALGMAGTSWNCRLMAVCAADPLEDNSISYGFEGIVWAAAHGAKVINCSWYRAGGWANRAQSEQDVITWATGQGALVVAAAGNNHLQHLD